jgi:hypothetical protein
MAQVVLLSVTPEAGASEEALEPLMEVRRRAAGDKFGVHSVTSDPDAADIILFVERYGAGWYFGGVRKHPYVRKHREKCFIFCSNPFVIPLLPGIYTGVERRWSSRRTLGGFYLGTAKNPFTTFTPPSSDLPYLYSFMGSLQNSEVRERLRQLEHPRGLMQDTSADYARALHREMDARERLDYHRRYAEATKASKFVLCPRGLSASTIRLFETMRMGRVPVILSDGWVEPRGPVWDKFAIRVREEDYAKIPRILEEREQEAVPMGELARAQWLEWFGEETAFHRIVEWCLTLQRERRVPEALGRWPAYLQFVQRFHFRRVAGATLRSLRGSNAP